MKNKLDSIFELLKAQKVTKFDISLGSNKGISTAVRMGKIETLQNHINQEFSITVYQDNKDSYTSVGHASSGDLSIDSLQKTIEAAALIAKYTSGDKFIGFAPKEELAWETPNLDTYYPWALSAKESIDITLECEQAALDNAKINNSEGCEIATFEGVSYSANSLGLITKKQSSSHSLHCGVIANDKDDMQNAYEMSIALDKNDLLATKFIGENAAKKAIEKLNAKTLPSQKCSIILSHEISSGLFGNFFSAISGSKQYHKTTFLLDSVEKQIFPKWLNIEQKPLELKTIGASAFDNDGVKTRQQHFIKDGYLQSYLLSQYTANQLKLKTTGNSGGIFNSVLSHSNLDFSELLQKMDKGILVTELMGQGVDITTGNYSRGATGFWVENGIIQYPVSGFTIAGNLSDMFQNIVAIANDIDDKKVLKVGSVLIEEMAIAGT
jgi:PmbA protein